MALYGSWSRGTKTLDSDIDLLVISEQVNPKKHRRGKEIVMIKDCLSIGRPFDILLLTPQECLSNFQNHNPLFLDIVWEGIVFMDSNDFLSDCIKETRNYIVNKGIVKLPDGWIFPVEYRRATNLSSVSNEEFARAILVDAQRDYLIGEIISREGFYDKAVYHFQQAGEKSLKAILICFGNYKKSHFISDYLIETMNARVIDSSWRNRLRNIAQINKEVEPEVTWSRYPGVDHGSLWLPSLEYTKEDALHVQQKIEVVLKTAREFVFDWFIDKG